MDVLRLKDKARNFKVIKKVGEGAFGEVYKVELVKYPGKTFAIKCELPENSKGKERLEHEYNYYLDLNNNLSIVGIPSVYWYGIDYIKQPPTKDCTYEKEVIRNILLMEYLGPSLEKLFLYMEKKFTIKTILMIGIQTIERLEFIHNNAIIHRDIKPDNFLVGSSSVNKKHIHIVDFGLSKKFIDLTTYKFTPFKNTHTFTGTYRFCSLRSHKRLEQSRRDDLESLGYMLIYFFRGFLPWQGVKDDNHKNKSELVFQIKQSLSIEKLCEDCPPFMITYMKYCRLLRHSQVPDYFKLKSLIIGEMNARGLTLDYDFDWSNM